MEEFVELQGSEIATLLIPTTVTLISARSPRSDMGDRVATIAWAMPISHEPSLIAVAIRPAGSTAQAMAESGCFVINVLGATDEAKRIAAICGKKQGVESRYAEAGLTVGEATCVDAPRIEQAVSWIECELEERHIYGDHELFIGRTLVAVTRGTLDEHDKLVPKPVLLMGQRGSFGRFEKGMPQ
jgi:flavin reductase (DIM6/NTAB) family NADH-FMN oxidoreductase RutF